MRRALVLTTLALGFSGFAACSSESQDAGSDPALVAAPVVAAPNNSVTSNGVTATLTITSDWGSGYCAAINVVNGSSTAVSSWKLTLNLNASTVNNIWNASTSPNTGVSTLTPASGFASIAAKASVSVGFCANATSTGSGPKLQALTVVGGGTGGTGGSPSTGGTTSTGGAIATGGTTATAGTTSFACGLPVAGNSGQPKPSGTPGNLRVINWAGLPGAVSYSFDDANSSQIQNYATLQALGVPMTFYLLTSKVEAGSATWAQAIKDGHELGNHTQTHNSVPSASDIEAAQTFIQQKFGVRAWTFAAPNGANSAYLPYTQPKFFLSRGVSNGLIAPNGSTDPWNLPAFIPASGAPASAFNSQMDAAKAANSWRIVLVHGFTGGTDGAYQPVALSAFTSSVQYAKSIGMWADTVTKIGAYWRGQKAVSAATTTTSGTTKTYNWTLPANFPPGKCLRVTADGGTLKQGGKTLVWNDRGYYEISLDLGAVTISP